MKRNFRSIVTFLALLVTLAILASCQTKKKSLDLQKEKLEQSSEVKKEERTEIKDQSTTEKESEESSWTKVVEEWFAADTNVAHKSNSPEKEGIKTPIYRKTTYSKTSKKEAVKQANDIQASHVAKSDSAGKKKEESKSKVSDKEKTEFPYLQVGGSVALLGILCWAIWAIWKQVKRAKAVKEEVLGI